MKYTIKDFQKQFPDDNDCLDYIFNERYGKDFVCKCGHFDCFYRVKARKSYACSWCGAQLNPTAGTIFHKSDTKLTLWFFAIYLMSQSKNGVAAKELERQLGVTYKTAWRMAKQIRKLMTQDGDQLSGIVEADETYIGGVRRGTRGRGAQGKTAVFGMVERDGDVKATKVENVKANTLMPIVSDNVAKGSTLMTDEFRSYGRAKLMGYGHESVKHAQKQFVNGMAHTNSIEGFWGQLKRSTHGTYHAISSKHLQAYLDEFAFRYNLRQSPVHPFAVLMAGAWKPA